MNALQKAAAIAVRRLSEECADANWPLIERIERRFRIVGAGQYYRERQQAAELAWERAWIARIQTWEDRLWLG